MGGWAGGRVVVGGGSSLGATSAALLLLLLLLLLGGEGRPGARGGWPHARGKGSYTLAGVG